MIKDINEDIKPVKRPRCYFLQRELLEMKIVSEKKISVEEFKQQI